MKAIKIIGLSSKTHKFLFQEQIHFRKEKKNVFGTNKKKLPHLYKY